MAASRRLFAELTGFRSGLWQSTVGADLHGKTLGVLGLGTTGQLVARYARAFGMRLVAWSQNMSAELAGEHGALRVSKEELFEKSDVVSIHLRLSDRTRGLVGRREFFYGETVENILAWIDGKPIRVIS